MLVPQNKLKGFEFPKALHIESVAFTEEANLLTPTFKAKRPQMRAHYEGVIDQLYETLNNAGKVQVAVTK